jgi:hypothetical protein
MKMSTLYEFDCLDEETAAVYLTNPRTDTEEEVLLEDVRALREVDASRYEMDVEDFHGARSTLQFA